MASPLLLAAIDRLAAHAYVTVDEADSSGSSGMLIERAIERVMPRSKQRAQGAVECPVGGEVCVGGRTGEGSRG